MNENRGELSGEIATVLGIVSQFYTARINKLLGAHNFTLSQFSLLTLFARHGQQQWTVSQLVQALEINQPGITKIVQKLLARGLLTVTKDKADSRKKLLQITEAGLTAWKQALLAMEPDVSLWFADWEIESMQQFKQRMEMLVAWLDNNRLE